MATYSSSTTRYETNNGYWITLPAFQKLKRFFWQPGPSISNSLFILFLSYFLSVISVCYISIYVKVRRSRHPQHHVADGLKKKTDEYIISIHPWIFVNFPAEGSLLGCV